MIIGNKIKEIRKKQGLTQKELANLTGLSEISIRKYENNNRKPKIENIKKIANALNVDVFDIINFKNFEANNWNDIDIDKLSELTGKIACDSKSEEKESQIFARINYSIFEVLDYVIKMFPNKSDDIINFLKSDDWEEFNNNVHNAYQELFRKLIDEDINI